MTSLGDKQQVISRKRNRLNENTEFSPFLVRVVGTVHTGGVVALTFFRPLKTCRLTFLHMRNKCKIVNVQRNNKGFFVLYKCHELFVNSPVMITVRVS